MKKVIIGHRGVGKTELLKRHSNYFSNVTHADLDLEIEKASGKSIATIFAKHGEEYFRKLEIETFNELASQYQNYVISLGAGFDLNQLNAQDEVLFVSRITDQMGRIFIDRPRLDKTFDPLEEFQQRFIKRQPLYQNRSDTVYFMPEGIESENELEKIIITKNYHISEAIYTLANSEISQLELLKKNYGCIELRSDLISMDSIHDIVKTDTKFNWLVSVRTNELPPTGVRLDFDIQIKNISTHFFENNKNIISCHESNIGNALDLVKNYKDVHIKLSPRVENFEDLLIGHNWQQAAPQSRSFLPRSETGKWVWFRQLSKYWQNLNFVRNRTNLADQPSQYQWLCLPVERPNHFAAVLGSPVSFSRSPEIHQNYFNEKKSFFTAIELTEAEFLNYFSWLTDIGLKYVAVTSPLKKLAFKLSTKSSDYAKKFASANTLICKGTEIYSENTDWLGFQKMIQDSNGNNKMPVAVWGGGGTLQMMKSVLPKAHFFSSRENTADTFNLAPELVIWAAPRTSLTKYPPETWQPKLVLDLNYLENSMGLEYAQKKSCSYLSGLSMFKTQALYQQKYWSTP